MTGALLIAALHDGQWAAGLAALLQRLGFAPQLATPGTAFSPASAGKAGLVIAGPGTSLPPTLLEGWHAAGALCGVAIAPGTQVVHGAFVARLPVPTTEAAILAMLAERHYLALPAHEAAAIPAAIAAQTLGDKGFAAELLQALMTSAQADLAQLRAAGTEMETCGSIAHRMKSSAHYVGCDTLRMLAQRMEDAARSGDAGTVLALRAVFEPTCARLVELLAAMAART
ncbi:Hpt domain-containing protein [Cupriavidus consociatus]|uniref:Hpt domain-containing protein n=1 Tax=Cupriavidus consociatus TaxID=2821357 RepID=UPI001AE9E8CE|nr:MULTISPECIES: Hpt domain-containing protein [unclassified Cupriavidus]MBP0624682.1 Hpt domain-containing protein [Cupriavidus sp. LEh25]MDK2661395.1 Hpt domain-containing protein [Cupriavidus sp. LEh21]